MLLAITRKDGGITITKTIKNNPTESEINEIISKWTVPGLKEAQSYKVITQEDIPVDRTFRDAWIVNEAIETDMKKALEIAKKHIRKSRKPKLEELDIAYQKEDEKSNGQGKADIAAKKQAARDATVDIRLTTAKNEDELKTAMEAIQAEIQSL